VRVELAKKHFAEVVFLLSYPDDACNYAGISVQDFTDLLLDAVKIVSVKASLRHIVNHQVTAALIVAPHHQLTALKRFFTAQSTLSITQIEWPDKSRLTLYDELTRLISEASSGRGIPMPPQLYEPIAIYSFGIKPEPG